MKTIRIQTLLLIVALSFEVYAQNDLLNTKLPEYLTTSSQIGDEITITGKWTPLKGSSKEALKQQWDNIHSEARNQEGMLLTEVNHAKGRNGVLVHHVFENTSSLLDYFRTSVAKNKDDLYKVGQPDLHLIRGMKISEQIKSALKLGDVEGDFGEYLFGYVKNDYQKPDQATAIQVTAKWTVHEDQKEKLEELIHWWQQVGTDAYHMERGLVRFEVYKVIGENALIIHETFENTDELKFHLTKGTAAKYKKDIDGIAAPEGYFFRGPVSWMIRTYSKFIGLPATYSNLELQFAAEQGSMSEGINY